MTVSFVQRLLADNVALFNLIHRFVRQPARHIHPTRWNESIPNRVLDVIELTPRSEARCSRWVDEAYGIQGQVTWDFSHPSHRIILLEPTRFQMLREYCGVAIFAREIARAIDRTKQSEIRNSVGEDLYQFALKRAGFLIRHLPAFLLDDQPVGKPFRDRMSEMGLYCLTTCMIGLPKHVWPRVLLKLPVADESFPTLPDRWSKERERIWSFVRRVLVTEISPELQTCFN